MSEKSRTAQVINNIVPAGGTLPMPINGSLFYLLVATLPLKIRPAGGVFNPFGAGQGQTFSLENQFNLLEIRNENTVAVVFSIYVGFEGFIDNTLIINQQSGQKEVAYATSPVPNVSANIAIPDLSGSPFVDSNGSTWYALERVGIYVSNADAAAVYSLANNANTKDLIFFQPLQTLNLPWSGNFRMQEAGNINAIVAEVYRAIPSTV